jgi:hypothetical protein
VRSLGVRSTNALAVAVMFSAAAVLAQPPAATTLIRGRIVDDGNDLIRR